MKRQDMKQGELAEKTGISRTTINYIVNGKSCSDAIGYRIAEALGVPVEQMIETRN